MVQAFDRKRPAVCDARTLRACFTTSDPGFLRQSRARTRSCRIPAPRGKAGHHAGEPAQYLHADGADPAGHAHAAWGGDGDRRGAQGPGQGRRAGWRTGHALARAVGRTLSRRCSFGQQRHCARARAAVAPQSDRCRARPLASADTRPPVGRHIPDFVSFVQRIAIELINANESEAIETDRALRRNWLEARGYRVIDFTVADVERDLVGELDRLAALLPGRP